MSPMPRCQAVWFLFLVLLVYILAAGDVCDVRWNASGIGSANRCLSGRRLAIAGLLANFLEERDIYPTFAGDCTRQDCRSH